mmetsp:Transcript_50697/g.122300  ORF Transcript_50697/g.122300 Transcript_50697/m.122300 type:complete len:126 (-) Transcript_50697:14-391(-)
MDTSNRDLHDFNASMSSEPAGQVPGTTSDDINLAVVDDDESCSDFDTCHELVVVLGGEVDVTNVDTDEGTATRGKSAKDEVLVVVKIVFVAANAKHSPILLMSNTVAFYRVSAFFVAVINMMMEV